MPAMQLLREGHEEEGRGERNSEAGALQDPSLAGIVTEGCTVRSKQVGGGYGEVRPRRALNE